MPGAGLWALCVLWPRAAAELRSGWTDECVRPYAILPLPLQCAVEGLVEGCSGFFVILGRDLALFLFYLELEQFFFQRFEQHRRSSYQSGRGGRGRRRGGRR